MIIKKIARRIIDQSRYAANTAVKNINRKRQTLMLDAMGSEGRPRHLFTASESIKPVNMADGTKIELLGHIFDLENKNLWNYSPDTKSCWPEKYFKDIDLLDADAGDYKLIWELGRLQFLPGMLTHEPKLGERILARFLWEVQSLKSIHWFSEMEIAIRMISLMLSLSLLDRENILHDRCVRTINIHYHYLKDNLTTHWKLHNNHLLVECIALMCYEMLFELPESSDDLLSDRWQLLCDECRSQIFADGGIGEQSTSYARFNLDAFLMLCITCRKTGNAVPQWFEETVVNMLRFLSAIKQPDNTWPMIGDGDDGRVIPPASGSDFWDFRGHFSIAGNIFDNEELQSGSQGIQSDFDWFCQNDFTTNSGVYQNAKAENITIEFKKSGYWLRKTENKDYLLLRAGHYGLGGDGFAPHSHCDELGIVLWLNGQQILTDCGTYTYEPRMDNWRKYFQSCAAHNVIEVDGRTQAEPKGNFSWGKNPHCKITNSDNDSVTARFSDYANIYLWTRHIRCNDGEVVLNDSVKFNDGETHQLKWFFNFAADLQCEIINNTLQISNSNNKFEIYADTQIQMVLGRGFVSRGYGHKQEIPQLVANITARESIEVEWKICTKY